MKYKLAIDPLSLLGIVFTLGVFTFLIFFIDTEDLRTWVLGAGIWAPLAFVFFKMLTIVVAPLSGAILYPLVGFVFGFWEGLLYVAIGDFLGYSINFWISRLLGQKAVLALIARKEEGLLAKIVDRMSTVKGFLSSCLVLFFSPELLSYGAGLSQLPYWKFILILWTGSVAATSLLVAFGSSVSFDAGESILITLAYPILGGMLMLGGGWFFLRGMRKTEETHTDSIE